jgi:hypothetical protein
MTANAGKSPTNGTWVQSVGGAGGTVTGDFDIGHAGQNGNNGGAPSTGYGRDPYGGQGRNISGVLGGSGSDYSGYIYVMITK